MANPPPQSLRRLAAILAVDIVGSSRLMEADEPRALAAIQTVLSEVINPATARHQGRVVKTMGDGALLEFASPVEAVLFGVEVQAKMAERHARPGEAIELRMGINLGDIMVTQDGDIHGDTVNIAARLESSADPGTVLISGKVFEELEGKLSLPFEDRGEQSLKNIARPIRVYAIKGQDTSPGEPQAVRLSSDFSDRPSIAVLPFTNLSGDPEQEYFAEGISDDILTALAKSRWLFVMARNSSFAFKGRAIETDQIARRLGVRYILSGSVRRSASRMRVSAQLVEAHTGGAIWAERYDRKLDDIFTLQDEISESVAGAIEPELLKKEGRRGAERPQSSTAWDLVRRGMWEFHKVTPESHRLARDLFLKAIEADQSSADGYIWLARTEAGFAAYGWTDDAEGSLRRGMAAACQAVQLDEKNPYSHYAISITHTFAGHCTTAIEAAERAVSLSPSFALGHLVLGAAHLHAGQPAKAIEPLEHGLRLSPFDPQNFSWLFMLATAQYFAGHPEEGLANIRRALALRPRWRAALRMSALCALGSGDEATARNALLEMNSSTETGADLTRIIGSMHPSWAAEMDAALQRLEENRQ